MEKILVVGLTDGIGGVENFICNINQYIDRNNYVIDYLVHQEIAELYKKRIQRIGNKIYIVPGIKNSPLKWFKEINSFYSKHKEYKIIHLHECSATFFIYVLPILFDKNRYLIVHSHNGKSSKPWLHYLFKFIQNKRVNYKCACSRVAADWMFGKDSECEIIHNGIDISLFKYNPASREIKRSELGISKDDFVIGSIARFDRQKNHDRIVEIFKEFQKTKFNHSKLVLVGSGSEKKAILNKVHTHNLDPHVIFLENRADVNELLAAFDMMLMPSLFEGLPFIVLEAQAASLPVLMSDAITKEVVLTELAIYESLDRSNRVWCDHIERIMKSNLDRTAIHTAAQLFQAGFDLKCSVHEIEHVYDIAETHLRSQTK